MKTITLFYLQTCPYCIKAKEALRQLCLEDPAYKAVPIHWIEESREPQIAAQYNYYYVPTLFCGKEKLYEASPSDTFEEIKQNIKAALNAAV